MATVTNDEDFAEHPKTYAELLARLDVQEPPAWEVAEGSFSARPVPGTDSGQRTEAIRQAQ
jgi:hypothetical protein